MKIKTIKKHNIRFAFTLLFAVIAPIHGAVAANNYTITDLGVNTIPNAINEVGQVAGTAYLENGEPRAFLYSAGNIRNVVDVFSEAYGLNNHGHVAGSFLASDETSHTFVFDGTNLNDILPGIRNNSSARGINDSGQVVGQMDPDITGSVSPFIYNPTTNLIDLINNVNTSTGNTGAFAINNSGQFIVNNGFDGPPRLYSNSSEFIELPQPQNWVGDYGLQAFAINNKGNVALQAATLIDGNVVAQTFLSDGTSITSLGAFIGTMGINDLDQVVVGSILLENSKSIDLNEKIALDSGWTIESANDINNLGQIIGTGIVNGEQHGFLLTPTAVPLPGAVWMFGSVVTAFVGLWRRKNKL